jgi:hypothetical protein
MSTILIPLRTQSESNLRDHWARKAKRAKEQRGAAALWVCEAMQEGMVVAEGAPHVTLTRIAPRALDADNLARSMKSVQDGVADALGIDDRHIRWTYAQERGGKREYAVRVEISAPSPVVCRPASA